MKVIQGYWHMYLINHWYSIVMDQLRIMLVSGLYDSCHGIRIGCIGDGEQVKLLEKLIIKQYPNLHLSIVSRNPLDYEFITLKLIEEDKGNYIGFYCHTKGVTKPADTLVNNWRGWLNESALNRWREHYYHITTMGYDVSAQNHCRPPQHPEHFSGNFWWFDREYINKLPAIDSLNKTNRWQAEQWVCKGKGRYYAPEFIESGRDKYLMQYSYGKKD